MLGAILASQQSSEPTHVASLTIDGLDVLKQPAVSASPYGVPIETIHLSVKGPGGVSSLEFSIDDPARVVDLSRGSRVVFWNIADDEPLFRGYVDRWDATPDFGQVGRRLDVACVGIESLLDWCLCDPVTIPAGTSLAAAFQSAAAAAGFPGRAFVGGASSSLAGPIASFSGIVTNAAITIAGGTSLRSAIAAIAKTQSSSYVLLSDLRVLATVDFYAGLRIVPNNAGTPSDIPAGSISIPGTGTEVASDFTLTTDAGAGVAEVYVTAGAITVRVSDGSGADGPVASITSSAVDLAGAIADGVNYLGATGVSYRASFRLEGFGGGPFGTAWRAYRPLGVVNVAAAVVDAPSLDLRVMTVDRTWSSWSRGELRVTLGALAPSVAGLARRLTRAVRS